MATFSKVYDNSIQQTREVVGGQITGDGTVSRFAVFTAMTLYSVQATVAVAGTSVGAGAGITVSKVSGTSTTAVGTITLGSSTAGSTFNLAASTSAGGLSLAAGDSVVLTQGTDATVVAAYGVELAFNPQSTFTL